jgi:hypothetical protein
MEKGVRHITRIEELLKHASAYYKTLFGPEEGGRFKLDSAIC